MGKILLATLMVSGLTWFLVMQGTVEVAAHLDSDYQEMLALFPD